MAYILLLFTTVLLALQNISMKQYSVKAEKSKQLVFSGISTLAALVFFAVTAGAFEFNLGLLPYSIGFAIAYAAAVIGINLAIANGSLAISSLVNSYSLLIPAAYGVFILKDSLSPVAYVGIACLAVSLFLINTKSEKIKFSVKWIVFLLISFIGNGMCSTVQKMQQLKFDGAYKNEFMIIALAIDAVIFAVFLLCTQKNLKFHLKNSIKYAAVSGFANGLANLLVMLLTALLPSAILYPSISGGSVVIMFFVSIFVYREQLTKQQQAGYLIGVLSVVLLNL